MTVEEALRQLRSFFAEMELNAHGQHQGRMGIECLFVVETELERLQRKDDDS